MDHRHYIIFGLLFLLGCDAQNTQPSSTAPIETGQEETTDSWREQRLEAGKVAYEQACASCHDEGTDGAPAIGDRDAWSDRSPLWSAVLFEHSKTGYLKMPAKGAHEELTDKSVEAAGEYMLSVTFPEMPLD